MSVVINTNTAASLASYNLSSTNVSLQRSLNRLSSGSRINSSFDDAGGLAVSMKMSASIRRTDATIANVGNSISFLQTQDGVLKTADKVLSRMSELTHRATDVTKSTS
ncbi:MAG: flagellin, partial [Spartobacteria bacterium]